MSKGALRSFFSPYMDLFVTTTIFFIIIYVSAFGPGRGNSNQRIEVSRGGLFKYSTAGIAIESAPLVRQVFLNSFFEIEQEWYEKAIKKGKDLRPESLKLNYRVLAGADPVENIKSLENWALSFRRGQSAFLLGLESRESFQAHLRTKLFESLQLENPSTEQALLLQALVSGEPHFSWLYAHNYAAFPSQPPKSYLLVWWKGQSGRQFLLFRFQNSGIELTPFRIQDTPDKDRKFWETLVDYREEYPVSAVNMLLLFFKFQQYENGYTPKYDYVVNSHYPLEGSVDYEEEGAEGFIADTAVCYVPYFQIVSQGSYGGKSFAKEKHRKKSYEYADAIIAKIRDKENASINDAFDVLHKVFTVHADSLRVFFLRDGQKNVDVFCSENRDAIAFLVSNQLARSLSIEAVEYGRKQSKQVQNSSRNMAQLRNNNEFFEAEIAFPLHLDYLEEREKAWWELARRENRKKRAQQKRKGEKADPLLSVEPPMPKSRMTFERLNGYQLVLNRFEEVKKKSGKFDVYTTLFGSSKKKKVASSATQAGSHN